MKKFITLTAVLALIAAVFIISFVGGIYLIQSKVSFKLPEGKHILVLGDSRTKYAVNDNIFSCAENVAQSSEVILFSYCKLRKFLAENEQLNTVILSYWGYTVRAEGMERELFSESYMVNRIPLHLPLMDKEDIAVFSGKKASFIYAVLHPAYKLLINMLTGKPLSYKSLAFGGYKDLHRDKLQEDIERWNRAADKAIDSISVYQKTYLLKIAELCKSKGVELILLSTPDKLEVYGGNELANDFHEAYLPDVKYMDYSTFHLPDSCYGDVTHLNYRGARIFSQYLQERFSADVKEIGEGNRWVYGGEKAE
ncbi:MAG: hypothetical protein LBH80_00530 [Prevotellaceae bacterium]|nr:hypothetical protein [Prevotellaceae bacterium]